MSEKIKLSPDVIPIEENPELEIQRGLEMLQLYEDSARAEYGSLKNLLSRFDRASDDEKTELGQKISKMANYLEASEANIAATEKAVLRHEQALGIGIDDSSLFTNNNFDDRNDMLINSAIFYQQRVEALKQATGNEDVDRPFVQAIFNYTNAVARCLSATRELSNDDWEMYDRSRSIAHNALIDELNQLSLQCEKQTGKALIYRTLLRNKRNEHGGYENRNLQQVHDRLTAVDYAIRLFEYEDLSGLTADQLDILRSK